MAENRHDFDLLPEVKPTIPELKIPRFKPHISPEEVVTFTQRDQKLLLAFSVAAQQLEFILTYLTEVNVHIRQAEVENVKLRTVVNSLRESKKAVNRRRLFMAGLVVTALTAAASALGSWLVRSLLTDAPPPIP